MPESLAERLNKGSGSKGGGIAAYDGQVLIVVSFEKMPSQFQKGTNVARVTALKADGEEVTFIASPNASRQLFEIEDILPEELKVTSFEGKGGNKGYKFEAV